MRKPGIALAALAAVALGASAVPAAGGTTAVAERSTKTVKVADDYFSPTKLKVKSGDKVKYKWLDANLNTHNVVLTDKRPKGVKTKDFTSASGSIGIKFNPKFEKKGAYGFVCKFHKSVMTMTVEVKK